MKSIRFVKQLAFLTLIASSISACLGDSASNEPAVRLAITSPSSASTIDTSDSTMRLAGTANSAAGIFQVVWANDRGGEGVANGTSSWQTERIALQIGPNRITVIAKDSAGATGSKSIVINRDSGQPGSAILSWSAPTVRTDGSALTDLSGYIIYYGRMSGIYDYQIDVNNPGVLTYVIEDLVSGDWYFALTAYDSAGIESDRSNEVLRQIT